MVSKPPLNCSMLIFPIDSMQFFLFRLLPKAISLYLKYKFKMNVKIGTAGLFSLQDIVFLKNGYSVVSTVDRLIIVHFLMNEFIIFDSTLTTLVSAVALLAVKLIN